MTSKEKPEDATPEIAGTHADMASKSTNSPLDGSALITIPENASFKYVVMPMRI